MKKRLVMVNGHLDLITEDKHLDLDQIPPISVAAKRFL